MRSPPSYSDFFAQSDCSRSKLGHRNFFLTTLHLNIGKYYLIQFINLRLDLILFLSLKYLRKEKKIANSEINKRNWTTANLGGMVPENEW